MNLAQIGFFSIGLNSWAGVSMTTIRMRSKCNCFRVVLAEPRKLEAQKCPDFTEFRNRSTMLKPA